MEFAGAFVPAFSFLPGTMPPAQINQTVQNCIQTNAHTNPIAVQNALIEGMSALVNIETRLKAESRNINYSGFNVDASQAAYMDFQTAEKTVKAEKLGMSAQAMAGDIRAAFTTGRLTEAEAGKLGGVLTELVGDAELAEAYVNGTKSITNAQTEQKTYIDRNDLVTDNGIKLKVHEEAKNHLIYGQLATGRKAAQKRGVIGGHNLEQFKKVLLDAGFSVDDCIISIKPHGSIEGIFEVKYRIPARQYAASGKLEIVENQYKVIPYPKTVYDPKVISNETMYQWGVEAMKEAIKSGRIDGRRLLGYASNGLMFEGFIDITTGEITNFYPVID